MRGQLDLFPREGIDWPRLQAVRRIWLEEMRGDHGARLEFLSEQGLRLVMADLSPLLGETLHFFNPGDGETLHLRAGGGRRLLPEAERYFPAAHRWGELIYGGEAVSAQGRGGGHALVREGLLLMVEGGVVRGVGEAGRDFPRGVLHKVRAGQASFLLERDAGPAGKALSLSYLQALEEARGLVPPPGAVALRALLLELARVEAHLEWLEAAARVLERWRTAARCASLRRGLRAGMEEWPGESPRGGWAVPGGVSEDFPLAGAASFAAKVSILAAAWKDLYRRAASLPVPRWAEKRLGLLERGEERGAWVGPMARAAGMARDARSEEPGVYGLLGWEAAAPPGGRGMLRRLLAVRCAEISSSLEVALRILRDPPTAPLLVKRGRGGRGEGFGRCEGPEGEVCCHAVLEKGRISFLSFSLPHELNRSAARVLEGCRLDALPLLSLAWAPARGRAKG